MTGGPSTGVPVPMVTPTVRDLSVNHDLDIMSLLASANNDSLGPQDCEQALRSA